KGFGDPLSTITHYPPAIARRAPDWVDEYSQHLVASGAIKGVPNPVSAIMSEVYIAVQSGTRRLAAMGIRAALEAVMTLRVGDQGSFAKNADALQAAGYLSQRQRLTLDAILDAGHATIHRGWEPTDQDLATLLDITESIVESVYIHEHRI